MLGPEVFHAGALLLGALVGTEGGALLLSGFRLRPSKDIRLEIAEEFDVGAPPYELPAEVDCITPLPLVLGPEVKLPKRSSRGRER